ncbi:hypothetical protein [Pseudobacteriovorax antillogorgiicola]|uniref:Uncharacterized protein n=1 Tax=Pseudobacteriovorax antillogorgiicola TaxID=1513793 RepID=A0A1Y6CXX3_9BACT|nr:hypothetical protein [Pseudobacteriovorax antillogorgiicola]TCS40912.1 hypothetical protein EDD56_15211 [Pseudobacteriovorax antillogorgiicola]SMF84081.1 hypothetical protein SAMN06296036_1523 [Pseudobacteriovorax antillogorgiicola]
MIETAADFYSCSLLSASASFAHNRAGVSEEWVIDNYGKAYGLKKAENMVQHGLLVKSGNIFRAAKEVIDVNAKEVLQRIFCDVSSFDCELVGGGAWYHRFTGYYSKETAESMKKATQNYIRSLESHAEADQNQIKRDCFVKVSAVGTFDIDNTMEIN